VTCSGKFVVLDELLLSLHAKGHKTLIFSQFTKTIDLLDDYLRFLRPQWRYARLDGSTHFTERGDLMREFNDKASDTTVFLLSTRAGGVGINLCAADTVVIFDSDWNPHMDSQAQDRAHRIGQTKPVLVIRLVSTRSVELKIIARANSKRKLDRVVCSKHASATAITALTSDELRQMLNDDFSGLDVGAANARTIALLADRARMFDAGLPKNGEGYEVCDWKASSLVGEI
jgi:ATP-dependent DNA helicase